MTGRAFVVVRADGAHYVTTNSRGLAVLCAAYCGGHYEEIDLG